MSDIQLVVSNFLSSIKEYLDCILRFQKTSTQNAASGQTTVIPAK